MLASILYLFFSLYMLISIIVATGEVVLVPVACMFYMTLSPGLRVAISGCEAAQRRRRRQRDRLPGSGKLELSGGATAADGTNGAALPSRRRPVRSLPPLLPRPQPKLLPFSFGSSSSRAAAARCACRIR